MKNEEKHTTVDTNDLIEITDEMDVLAYITRGETGENGERDIYIRIRSKDKFDLGLNFGPVGDSAAQFFDKDGKMKNE